MRGVPYEQVVLKLASVLTAVLFCLAQAPLPGSAGAGRGGARGERAEAGREARRGDAVS
jgi:hypothetical protein